jgi:Transposase DDE domain group 1
VNYQFDKGFMVTNLGTSSRAMVRFYNKRGTAEQWIKEGKQAVALTRLSCHRFRTNQAGLLKRIRQQCQWFLFHRSRRSADCGTCKKVHRTLKNEYRRGATRDPRGQHKVCQRQLTNAKRSFN